MPKVNYRMDGPEDTFRLETGDLLMQKLCDFCCTNAGFSNKQTGSNFDYCLRR